MSFKFPIRRWRLEDLEREVLRGLVVRVFFVLQIIPHVASFVAVQVRVDLNLERLALRNALFFPHKKAIKQKKEVVQVTCNVEHGPPLDKSNVVGVLR